MRDAVVENWLLGEADEILISPYSTFGFVAHGRTGLKPYIVTSDTLHCFQMDTSQPCFQYWFGMTRLPCWKDEWASTEMINQHDCYL